MADKTKVDTEKKSAFSKEFMNIYEVKRQLNMMMGSLSFNWLLINNSDNDAYSSLSGLLEDILGRVEDAIDNLDEALNIIVTKENKPIHEIGSLVALQKAYDLLKNTNQPGDDDINIIDLHVKEITDFVHNIAVPAISLKNKFDDLQKSFSMSTREKTASIAGA